MHMKTAPYLTLLILIIATQACRKPTPAVVTDIDGNTYPVIKIGNQYWMAQNLRVTRYRNGDSIPYITDTPAWSNTRTGARCNYNNDTSLLCHPTSTIAGNGSIIADSTPVKQFYGCLYNWYAISDPRQLAPTGWHIPTAAELDTLVKNLRGDTVAGAYLKATSWNTAWLHMPTADGFNALPGGYRMGNDGSFHTLGSNGYWWHTHGSYELFAWSPRFYSTFADVKRDPQYYTYGLSVRCIKD